MRRKDRELTEQKDLIAIMEKCDVCRIALNTGDYPYILPLNFGMARNGDTIELYFHGALEGRKYDLIRQDCRAGFEMDCAHQLATEEESGNCTMKYESVIGQGRIYLLSEEEKQEALDILMKHYHLKDFAYNKAVIPMTNVFKLVVEHMTGKRRT